MGGVHACVVFTVSAVHLKAEPHGPCAGPRTVKMVNCLPGLKNNVTALGLGKTLRGRRARRYVVQTTDTHLSQAPDFAQLRSVRPASVLISAKKNEKYPGWTTLVLLAP